MLAGFLNRGGSAERGFAENATKVIEQKNPLRRLDRPEEAAYAALYLVSDEASFVNGVILPLDGGIIGMLVT
jgi:3-oxoacyl-[acyl-carrier protein] reductase